MPQPTKDKAGDSDQAASDKASGDQAATDQLGDQLGGQVGDQAGDQAGDLSKADIPDAQSLRDALRQWKEGDDVSVIDAQQQGPESGAADVAASPEIAKSSEGEKPVSPWAKAKKPSDKGVSNTAANPVSTSAAASASQSTTQPTTQPAAKSASKSASKASSGDKSNSSTSKKKVSRNQARRFARQRAVQAIYQWDYGHVDVGEVLGQFEEFQNLSNVDLDHFQRLFRGVALAVSEVDALLEPALDRPVTDLDPIERSILRMATVELRDCLQTPARVVINEAVELTKRFGADQGHKYVNGVIDKVALALRETEMKAGRKS